MSPTSAVAAAHQADTGTGGVDAADAALLLPPHVPSVGTVGAPLPHLKDCIYLDYNGTSPIFPEVAAAMQPFLFQQFGNPSSGHAYGRRAAAAVAAARASVASLIGAAPEEVYFTACGTEADNWAITGAVMAARAAAVAATAAAGGREGRSAVPPHVVTSAVEHPAVLACLEGLAAQQLCTYTIVGVDASGLVSPADVAAALRPSETVLVTVMHSNNEVGAIQPVAEIAAAARAAGALCHTDAAQSIGKVPIDVNALGVDMLTLVGHKFGCPKGIGALYIRRGAESRVDSMLRGGGQERGARAGTEATLLIAGLGAAAGVAARELSAIAAHMAATRDALEQSLLAAFTPGAVRVNGPADPSQRLPNTLSISIRGLRSGDLLSDLSDRLAASAAAACHSGAACGAAVASPVLRAMGLAPEWAAGTLRLSTGRHTTMEEVGAAVGLITEAAARQGVPLRAQGKS